MGYYVVITVILYIASIIFAMIAASAMAGDSSVENNDWKIYRAVVAVGLVTLWLWPLALVLAVPAFIIWGLVNAYQLFSESRKGGKETVNG